MDDIRREEIPDFLFRLAEFITAQKSWQGTATDLLTEMKESEITSNAVTKLLAHFSAELLEPRHIQYRTKRTGANRLIKLRFCDSDDANDGERSI